MKQTNYSMPNIMVKVYYVDSLQCNLYHLYVNGELEAAYPSKIDLKRRLNLIMNDFLGGLDNVD